ncbi:CYP2J [Lepeophtheirus salmonis]|uniref:CYP2J n=1 Tax=Lepeophtheirus salmonis TaxID=72036 RepID=A0A7R8GYT2_LEPSM|nr:CYP2J [Lepeophtheirus salmonis]CAF2752005.1 CYP2J [Lepeophtheirus salmonis]
MAVALVITVCLILAVILYEIKWKYPQNYPPLHPFVFHSLVILFIFEVQGKNFQEGFDRIFDRFNVGGVLCLQVAARIRMVMISDFDILKKILKTDDLNYRLAHDFSIDYTKKLYQGIGVDGVLWSYGSIWKQQRRFMLSTLKNFGFGRSSMEDMLMEEATLFVNFLNEENIQTGGNIRIANLFNIGILNVLWRIVAGTRFEYRDPELQKIVHKVGDAILSTNLKPTIAAIFPFLRTIYPGIDDTQEVSTKVAAVYEFLQTAVKNHEGNFDPNHPRDFIDTYLLKKIKDSEENPDKENDSFRGELGKLNLSKTLLDLFFAGSETTSSTLSWGVLFMVRHPEIQKKVQEELDLFLHEGDGESFRKARSEDRIHLPYTEAVICEIQRRGNITPMGVPHATYSGDAKVGNYVVPKGHVVNAYLSGIFRNPKYFGPNPDQFNPDRFLEVASDGGVKFIKNEYLIPFSIGKRSCPGENLARMEIFSFFTSILQRFELRSIDGEIPSTDFISGITSIPKPFNIKLIPRDVKIIV